MVYKGLKKNEALSRLPLDKKEYGQVEDKLVMLKKYDYLAKAFPNREKPLTYDDSVYDYESVYGENIGSYSTYNWFRSELENFVSRYYNDLDDLFAYLTEFSDCEGVFGSECCAILRNEFCVFEEAFKKYVSEFYNPVEVELLTSMYRKFKNAFTFGAEGGAVVFC